MALVGQQRTHACCVDIESSRSPIQLQVAAALHDALRQLHAEFTAIGSGVACRPDTTGNSLRVRLERRLVFHTLRARQYGLPAAQP